MDMQPGSGVSLDKSLYPSESVLHAGMRVPQTSSSSCEDEMTARAKHLAHGETREIKLVTVVMVTSDPKQSPGPVGHDGFSCTLC